MSDTSKAIIVKVEDETIEATEAEVTTHDHGTFTVVCLQQGRFSTQVFRGSYGQHRNVHVHGVTSVKVEDGMFGPRFIIGHADGTETRIHTYDV